MKVARTRTREQVRQLREAAILKAWPLAQQAEAVQDQATGRPEKWNRMQAEIAAIKARYPWPVV